MAADILGLDKPQESKTTTTDFLGQQAPLAFSAQPALPAGGPAGAGGGPSAAPPTIAGTGVAPSAPEGTGAQQSLGFGDLANAALPGGDAPGGGEVGEGATGGSLPGVSVGPFSMGLGGSVGVRTGNQASDLALNTALGMGARAAGLSTNIPTLLALLTQNPALAMMASAAGAFSTPFAFAQLADIVAHHVPGSVVNMQAALNENDPHFTSEEAAMMGKYGLDAFAGPKMGGAQTIGSLAPGIFDAPVMGPQGASYGLSASNPSVQQGYAANADQTNAALAALAAALGFGRTDTPAEGPAAAPAGPGPSASVSGGEESGGGPGPGPGDTGDGATGDF